MSPKVYISIKLLLVLFISCNITTAKKTNTKIEYFEITNQIKHIKQYRDGKLEGESIWFYINGNIEQKSNYHNGKPDGLTTCFYPSGAIECYRYFKEGNMQNVGYNFWDDTTSTLQIKSKIYFNNEGFVFYLLEYDKSGKIINEEGAKPPDPN